MDESAQAPPLVVGIDVGGTNTDAILLRGSTLIAFAKVPTTADVSTAVLQVVNKLFSDEKHDEDISKVSAVFLGTTALVNALLEGRGLDTVAVVRLCGPSSRSLPPFCDFPPSLKKVICAGTWFASGGLRFDGREECCISEEELQEIAATEQMQKADAVVVSCTFSPADDSQEQRAACLLRKSLPSLTRVTCSSQSGQLGLLARENSAILDACLSRTAHRAATNIRRALQAAGSSSSAKLYFTANDGSVISFQKASQSPLRCVACGPTNSLRGAAFLSSSANSPNDDDMDRIVLDIGGTSTDAGCLVHGRYPRDSNAETFIAGVRCNHRATDVVSIALGGGSIVSTDGTLIGPESVGADIASKALCFGGDICTATCIAVAMGAKMTTPGARAPRRDFDVPPYAATAWNIMQKKFYDLVESTRTDNSPIEVIVVGGGAGLVDTEALSKALGGCSVTIPDCAAVANACGSALAHGVGEAEIIADLSPSKREAVLSKLKAKAQALAGPGAHVIEHEEVKLAYLPGKMTRVFVRAVAPLDLTKQNDTCTDLESEEADFLLIDDTTERHPALRHADPPPFEPSPPNVRDGVWTISEYDAHCLAIGCGILGCGGGGSTFHGLLQLLAAIRDGRSVRVVSSKSIPSDSMVQPCGFMGAPSVSLETIGDVEQLLAAVLHNFEISSVDVGKAFIVPSEIGGCNGLMPLLVGGVLDRPIVDADLMGRAFPELQMTTASIYGLPQTPMTASDSFGRCVTIHSSNESGLESGLVPADALDWTERVLRPVCIEFGCTAGLAENLITGSELHRVGVLGSLSRARRIGDCVLRSIHPEEAIERILTMNGGRCLFRGAVSNIQRETTAGFAKGHVVIRAEDKLTVLTVEFQNEFLIARIEASGSVQVVGCVPDIISILDIDTARPIATEEIRFGCRVCVLLLPVSAKLRTEDALHIVGPSAFGLEETSYVSPLYSEARCECDDYQSIADSP